MPTLKDLRDNKNITTKLIKDYKIGDVVQTKFGNEDVGLNEYTQLIYEL